MVEQQLTSVNRDYELEKGQYSELTRKLREATIAENVERNRRGEQFTVLYAATLPLSPIKPVPWRVMVMSIVDGDARSQTSCLIRRHGTEYSR